MKPTRHEIKVLDPLVAERIAAGEVIERPASVVKELVENALDASATQVLIRLIGGGKDLIEVIDNGWGMTADEMTLAVQRHATSKLRVVKDLDSLHTLGFRGEALPSVSAVADLTIVSRTADTKKANEWSSRTGKDKATTFGHFLHSEHGTRMRVEGLFSQIPARLKFLKSQNAEVGAVRDWMEKLALTRPDVGFQLFSGERKVLQLLPQEENERVVAVLGGGKDYPVHSLDQTIGTFSEKGIGVRVHWLQGFSSPQARKIVQIMNGRVLKDRVLQQAILRPFRQALLPGQFPALAVYIEIDPRLVDVNVHPTKTEVRFLDSRAVFSAVHKKIEDLVLTHGSTGYASGELIHPENAHAKSPESAASESLGGYLPPRRQDTLLFQRPARPEDRSKNGGPWKIAQPLAGLHGNTTGQPLEGKTRTRPTSVTDNPLWEYRYSGSLFRTYLLFENSEEVALVDQHAADERIRFEKLKKAALGVEGEEVQKQELLLPEAIKIEATDLDWIKKETERLSHAGFEAEVFSEQSLLFRSIPGTWGEHQLRARLGNLVERLRALHESDEVQSTERLGMDETFFEALASEACHSSIRAGDPLEREEALALIDRLFATEHPWNCPHGRPTLIKVPRVRFEEWFKRKI